jgi:phage/plasmid primase-like uncharacterized protein
LAVSFFLIGPPVLDVQQIKDAARGQWLAILPSAGIPSESLDGKHGPCPKCGGTDRFRAFDDVAETGGVICNQCGKDLGDGLAAVQWITGGTFPEALQFVAGYLGIGKSTFGELDNIQIDPLTRLARLKSVSADSLKAYGATVANGTVEFPVWDGNGKQAGTFYIVPGGSEKEQKGLFTSGSSHGLFLPFTGDGPRLPQPGETWLLVEGVKDAAALHSLGYLAAGMPTSNLAAKFVRLFAGIDVVIVPDRDEAGTKGAEQTAARLYGTAASVKIAALPVEYQETNGADVRDVLKKKDGESLVRSAIDSATEWTAQTIAAVPNEDEDDANNVEPATGDPGEFPRHLLDVPGFVNGVKKWNLETATRPQETLALAGATCLLATLTGRKVRDPRGNRTSLYVAGIAPSGSGKEHARQVNTSILFHADLARLEGAEPASDAGLISCVERNPSVLLQIDELGKYLRNVINPNAPSHLSAIVQVLLRMYSAGNTAFLGKAYRDADENKVIHQPNLVVHGTTVPQSFYESLTAESVSDGFIARLLIFEAPGTLPPRQYREFGDPPKELVEVAKFWGRFHPGDGNMREQYPQPLVIQATPDARKVFDDLAATVDNELTVGRPEGQAIWARAEEKACRLALVHACSENHEKPEINDAAARWACDLAAYQTRRMIWLCSQWVAHSAFDSMQKKVVRAIRDRGGKMGRRELVRLLQHLPAKQRDDLILNLIQTRQLCEVTEAGGRGRPKTNYVTVAI